MISPYSAGSLLSLVQYGERLICRAEPAIKIISMIANQSIHLLQSLYFLTAGGIEAAIALISGRKVELTESPDKVDTAVEGFFGWWRELPSKIFSYSFIHGALMVGTGTTELLFGLEQFECIALGAATPFVAAAGNSCFLLANIALLIESAVRFSRAKELPKDATDEEKEAAFRIKTSAILSMISAINYIIGVAAMLIGGNAALTALFVALGLLFGGVRILYDWFQPANEALLPMGQIAIV